MQDAPSRTALRVALRRAAHQLFDARPLVLEDSYAVPILGPYAAELERTPGEGRRPPQRARTHSLGLRAFLVGRSRYAEDQLAAAFARGVRQYVLLGAGLDTFALRNPHPELAVFEVDHPATQAWKAELMAEAGLPDPPWLRCVPVDFETQALAARLAETGLRFDQPACFAWLGVVPYLTRAGFRATLGTIAQAAAGTGLVFDYSLPPETLSGPERQAHDSMAERVRAAGEPFQLFFTPEEVRCELDAAGLAVTEDLDAEALNARYFFARTDALRLYGTAGHLVHAEKPSPAAASTVQ